MAKNTDNELDDFQFDDDMFSEFDNFDSSASSKKKGLIKRLFTSFVEGASAQFKETGLRKALESTLPKSYKSSFEAYDNVKSYSRDIQNEALKEFEPSIRIVKKQADRFVKKNESWLPKKLVEALSNNSGDYSRDKSDEEVEDERIADQIREVFGEIEQAKEKAHAHERTEDLINQRVDRKIQTSQLTALGSIASDVNKLSSYQDRITHRFQQKSLELSYRQTFFLKSIVESQKNTFELLKEGLEGIARNTATPDYLKKSLAGAAHENLRTRTLDYVNSKATDYLSKFTGNITKNLTSKIKDAASSANMFVETIGDGDDDTGSFVDAFASALGSKAVDFLIPLLYRPYKHAISKIPGIEDGGHRADMLIKQFPQLINHIKKNKAGDFNGPLGRLLGLFLEDLPEHKSEIAFGSSLLSRAEKPAPFDVLTRQTIVEIIPGFLSRIHHELSNIRTGFGFDLKTPRLSYSATSGKFTDTNVVNAEIKKRLLNGTVAYGLADKTAKIASNFNLKGLNRRQKDLLTERLYQAAYNPVLVDENLFSPQALGRGMDETDRKALEKAFHAKYKKGKSFDYEALSKLVDEFKELYQAGQDPTELLEYLHDNNQLESLDASGLIEIDQNGNRKLNMDAFLKGMRETEKIKPEEKKKKKKEKSKLDDLTESWQRKAEAWVDAVANPVVDKVLESQQFKDLLQESVARVSPIYARLNSLLKRGLYGEFYEEENESTAGSTADDTSAAGTALEASESAETAKGPTRSKSKRRSRRRTPARAAQENADAPTTSSESAESSVTRQTSEVAARQVRAASAKVRRRANRIRRSLQSQMQQVESELNLLIQRRTGTDKTASEIMNEQFESIMGSVRNTIAQAEAQIQSIAEEGAASADPSHSAEESSNLRNFFLGLRRRIQPKLDKARSMAGQAFEQAKARFDKLKENASTMFGHVSSKAQAYGASLQSAASGDGLKNELLDNLLQVAKQQLEQLAAIRERIENGIFTIDTGQVLSARPGVIERWFGKSGKAIGKLTSAAWGGAKAYGSFAKSVIKGQWNVIKTAGSFGMNMAKAGIKGIGSIFDIRRRQSDVYVKGDMSHPVLFKKLMEEGAYLDVKTNKIIKTVWDIKGPVKNLKTGNIDLTQEEFDRGITDSVGISISRTAIKGFKWTVGQMGQYGAMAFGLPFKIAKEAIRFAKKGVELINEGQDVYLKGQLAKPVLLNKLIKEGYYYSAKTGRPIRSYKDVDGEIFYYDPVTKEKRIAITEEEARTLPLVNWRGKPLRTLGQKMVSGLFGMGEMAAKAAYGLAKGYVKVAGAVLGLGRDVIVGSAKAIGRFFNPNSKWFNALPADERQYVILKDILGLLMDRLPIPKKLRKGSWQEQYEKRMKDLEEKKNSIKDKVKDKTSTLFSDLKNVFGKGKKGLLSLLGLGGKDDEEEDDGSLISDAADALDVANDIGDIRERRRRRKAAKRRLKRIKGRKGGRLGRLGRLGRAGGAAAEGLGTAGTAARAGGVLLGGAALGTAAMSLGGGLAGGWAGEKVGSKIADLLGLDEDSGARTALQVGGGIAGGVGGAALTAGALSAVPGLAGAAGSVAAGIAGILSAPVLLTGAAIAAAGYGIYAGYKAYKRRRDEPFRKLRLAQYGIDVKDVDKLAKVEKLEDTCAEMVTVTPQGLQFDKTKIKPEDIFEAFDVDDGGFLGFFKKDRSKERELFIQWFNLRFKPVYLTWLTALRTKTVNAVKDLSEAWDKTNVKQRKEILEAVKNTGADYNFTAPIFNDAVDLLNQKAVDAVYAEVKALVDKQEEKAKSELKTQETIATTAGNFADRMDKMSKIAPLPVALLMKVAGKAARKIQAKAAGAIASVKVMPKVIVKAGDVLPPLTVIRLKAYGLKTMKTEKVIALLTMEKNLLPDIQFNGQQASYKKSSDEAYAVFSELFGLSIDDDSARKKWIDWFESRFMPVYLTFLSAVRLQSKSNNINLDQLDKLLKPSDQIEVAKATIAAKRKRLLVFNASIWSYTDTPWNEDEDLNDKVESTNSNMEALKAQAANAKAQEGTGPRATTAANNAPSAPPAPAKPATQAGQGSATPTQPAPPPSQSAPGADIQASQVNKTYDLDEAEDRAYWASKGVDASNIQMENNRFAGNVRPVGRTARITSPSGGTIKNVPMPTGSGPDAVLPTIAAAAKIVGVDPNLLATIANIESSFNPNAKARSSTASGLFQFISGTWNEMLRKYGAKFAIAATTSPFNPAANALLGAAFIRDNIDKIKGFLKREPTDVDAYMAHFLGAGGYQQLLKAGGDAKAAEVLPSAARANPNIFYKPDGSPRTVNELLAFMDQKKLQANRVEVDPSTTAAMSEPVPVNQTATSYSEAAPVPQTTPDKGAAGQAAAPANAPTAKPAQTQPGFFSRAATAVGNWASGAMNWTWNTAKSAYNAVSDAVSYAKDAVIDTAARAYNAVRGVGNTLAAKAASILAGKVNIRSVGLCAKYVSDALLAAGYKFVKQPSAFMYAKNGILASLGFKQIDPRTPPAPGDIMVYDRTPRHKHGHIQIFDGTHWLSDFRQPDATPYKDPVPVTMWRDTGQGATGQSVTAPNAGTAAAIPPTAPAPAGAPVVPAVGADISTAQPLNTVATATAADSVPDRDVAVEQLNRQAAYKSSMQARMDQLTGTQTSEMMSKSLAIAAQQLQTQQEISQKLSTLIDTVKAIKLPDSLSTTDTKQGLPEKETQRGATRQAPGIEPNPSRSPLKVVRTQFVDS